MAEDTTRADTDQKPQAQAGSGASSVAKVKASTETKDITNVTMPSKSSNPKSFKVTNPKKKKRKTSTKSTKKAAVEKKKKDRVKEEKKRKATAKDMILNNIKNSGLSWVTAAATVRDKMGYHRTTLYKWLNDVEGKDEDGSDVTFRDFVRMAERLVIGEFEQAQLLAAKGGTLTGWHEDSEVSETFQPDGKTLKKRVVKSKRGENFAPPNAQAAKDGLNRRLLRDRRIDNKPDELERVPDPIVEPAVDEEGNVIDFTKLHITFGLEGEDEGGEDSKKKLKISFGGGDNA